MCYSWRRRQWWRLRGPLPVAGCPLPSPHDWARLFIEHLWALGAGVRFAFGNFRFFSPVSYPFWVFDLLRPIDRLLHPSAWQWSRLEEGAEEWVDRQGVGCGVWGGLWTISQRFYHGAYQHSTFIWHSKIEWIEATCAPFNLEQGGFCLIFVGKALLLLLLLPYNECHLITV